MTEAQPNPSGRLRAGDLMLAGATTMSADRNLHDARRALVALHSDADAPNVLLIVDGKDHYLGMLTGRLLLKHFLPEPLPTGSPGEEPEHWDAALRNAAARGGRRRIGDVLARELPVVSRDDGLALLIHHGCEHRMEYIPVVEEGHPLGVVPITAVLTAAAALALRPDDEGIQVGEKRVK